MESDRELESATAAGRCPPGGRRPMLERMFLESWPTDRWADLPLVIAVSGGADSTALLRLMLATGRRAPSGQPPWVVAHFNHRWRGAASDADQAFVKDLAARWQLECHLGCPPPDATASRDEASARHLRYEFLHHLAVATGARHIVLAHTADDQTETVLHRILRGTGIEGLAGIPRTRQLAPGLSLIRPLLAVRRAQLLEYLTQIGQPFRHDASNHDTQYTRNRIRHALLPLLRAEYNPGVDAALNQLAAVARDAQQRIDHAIQRVWEQAVRADPGSRQVAIDVAACRDLSAFERVELLKAVWKHQDWPRQAMGYDQWCRLADLLAAAIPTDTAVLMLPGAIDVRARPGRLVLTRQGPPDNGPTTVVTDDSAR